jgi:hypothetical protein
VSFLLFLKLVGDSMDGLLFEGICLLACLYLTLQLEVRPFHLCFLKLKQADPASNSHQAFLQFLLLPLSLRQKSLALHQGLLQLFPLPSCLRQLSREAFTLRVDGDHLFL